MGTASAAARVKLLCGSIAGEDALLEAAAERLALEFGPLEARSEVWPFEDTDYYEPEMGPGLRRQWLVFAEPIDPGALADIKTRTNAIEAEWSVAAPGGRRRRRVNIDPGYLTPAKLVLATTKDFAHRIYLRDGIYAEVTLNFGRQGCRCCAWTYPDFRSGRYDAFLLEARRRLLAAAP